MDFRIIENLFFIHAVSFFRQYIYSMSHLPKGIKGPGYGSTWFL